MYRRSRSAGRRGSRSTASARSPASSSAGSTRWSTRSSRRDRGGADEREREELRSLLGKAAVANAKIAYAKYKEIFSSDRWKVLEEAGARVQRCLWASTSTKNPEYRDVMYVEPLIGRDTINTMPLSTLDAFREHGFLAETLEKGVDEAFATIRQIEKAGIDFKAVTDELQVQGVKLFTDSFMKANASIKEKRDALVGAGARG